MHAAPAKSCHAYDRAAPRKLSPASARFAREVQWFMDLNGYAPGYADIGRVLGVCRHSAQEMAAPLMRAGVLAWEGPRRGLGRGGLVLARPEAVFPRSTLLFAIGSIS